MIEILGVNDTGIKEQSMAYDEASLLDGAVRISDNALRADGHYKLIFKKEATADVCAFIEWEKGRRSDIRGEQGGIMIGKRYYDPVKDIHYAVAMRAIPARIAHGDTGYLDMRDDSWVYMYKKKEEYEALTGEETVILGWFHTHPNGLDCFFSNTDRDTQEKCFNEDNSFAVVLNPQRHLVKAYRSKDCYDAQAFFVRDGKTMSDEPGYDRRRSWL